MQKIVKKEKITSLELLDQINIFRKKEKSKNELRHDTLLSIIRAEFEEEISLQKILESNYKNDRGREYPMFVLTLNQAKQVLMRESKFVRRAVIQYIEKLEQALTNKPTQAKLPLEDIKPTTLNGVPVMEIQALAKMLGVSESHIHWLFRNDKTTLRGSKLINYKKENKNIRDYIRVNNISVLYKEIVITICKHFKVYEKYKDFIEKYFYVAKQIEYKTEKPFDDFYYNEMFECMKKAYQLESQVENIYNDKLLPIYNRIEELNNLKRDTMLTPFNAMKYGNVLGKRK